MRAVTPPNTIIETSSKPRKPSVRFSQVVHIAPYERATPAEARNIWFSTAEIGSFKQHARIMATVYRHYGGVPQPTEDDLGDLRTLYRGFENCTPTRQRRRLLSNRSVVYAHRNGMSDDFVAEMYKQCNKWSGEVAFVQAVHDYIDIFYSNNNSNNNSNSSADSVEPQTAPATDTEPKKATATATATATEKDTSSNPKSDVFVPELPDMSQGGILVYFHLYKTGGSSITELIVELKEEFEEEDEEDEEEGSHYEQVNSEFLESRRLVFVNNREDMTNEDIEWSVKIAKDNKKPVFYNFHVEFPNTMYPTLVEAKPVLDAWRAAATAAGVPLFVATVLREPLGHALSFFNFFHVTIDEHEWSPFAGDMDATEENFVKTFVPNRLCHLMYDDAHGILEAPDEALREGLLKNLWHFMDEEELNRRNEPSNCDVDKLKDILFDSTTFDYVGVTDRLSTHILPMFTKMIFGDAELARDAKPKKKASNLTDDTWVPLKKKDLSETTKAMVAEKSAKDQHLYEEARDRFAHWPEYFPKSASSSSSSSSSTASS